MMSKSDAADFLKRLAESSGGDSKQPRVIVVRSNRETKSFVAEALEQLERAGRAVDARESTSSSTELTHCFESISYAASQHSLPNLTDAICYAETLAALAMLVGQEEQERLNLAFRAILKYLSAAMLRVYVDGGDQNCGEELAVIRQIVVDSSPNSGYVLNTRQSEAHVLN